MIFGSTIYLFLAVLFDNITLLTWLALGVVIVELLVLIWNDWHCPLTLFAEQTGADSGSVANLFLPGFFAEHLFKLFGLICSVTLLLLIWRLLW